MKKIILILTFCLGASQFNVAQNATVSFSDEIPESQSITRTQVYNPQFANTFIYYMAHGLTVFKQTKELFLFDNKSLAITKKIAYPKYADYDDFEVENKGNMLTLKQNMILLYKKKNNKKYDIAAAKINEGFAVPDAPQTLFSIKNVGVITCEYNDNKDLCVFTKKDENKKSNTLYYWIFDNNLKLVKSDSAIFNPETDDVSVITFDDGYAVEKRMGNNTDITITNLKKNKTTTVNIKNTENKLILAKIKTLASGKLVVCGNYSLTEKKKLKNGVFRLMINADNSTIEEQIYFENVPAGKVEIDDQVKKVSNICIDETGICYIVLNQKNSEGYRMKNELFCIASNTSKWKKQLPIGASNSDFVLPMFIFHNELVIAYADYENEKSKIDYNNYVYGNPYPSSPVTLRQGYKSSTSVLNISSGGQVKHQQLADVTLSVMEYLGNGTLLGVYQGLDGQKTSKCKITKIIIK